MIGELETTRLRLRPVRPEDLELIVELNGDPEVMRYITGRPSSVVEVETELHASVGARWLMFDKSGLFLGWVGAIHVADTSEYDIGWRLRRAAWGEGYATEAATALVNALFADGASRVFAQTMAVNERSRSVMERIGLRYAWTFHAVFEHPLPGTKLGEVEYELTREDWELRT